MIGMCLCLQSNHPQLSLLECSAAFTTPVREPKYDAVFSLCLVVGIPVV